ncbi:HNH endonuclease family protein, partial [Streptomyces sp. NPDC055897]
RPGLRAPDTHTNSHTRSLTRDMGTPPRRASWCVSARRWVGIKAKYRLTVTPPEKTTLQDMLAGCG